MNRSNNTKQTHSMVLLLLRLLVYLGGYAILSLGQRLFVVAGLGAASLDAVCVGLERSTGLTAGGWVNITAVLMILISGFLRKKRPNFLAMISSFTFGLFFDLWGVIFAQVAVSGLLVPRIGIYMLAILLAPLGTAIYFISAFPKSAVDDFVMSFTDAFHLPIWAAKTLCEALFCILAFLFSGPLGVTTVITAFLFGPILQFFYQRITLKAQYNKETGLFNTRRKLYEI